MSVQGFLGSFVGGLFGSIVGITILGIFLNKKSASESEAGKSIPE
jgi:hypothetical protein